MTTAASVLETTVASRVAAVRGRIERACAHAGREPASVTLIAVSKTQPASAIAAAWGAGIHDFGENYVQEGADKVREVRALIGPGPRFHFIGHLQRNKAREAAEAFAILHSVDSERLLAALSAPRESPLQVMLQVNVAREQSKSGADPADLRSLVAAARSAEGIELLGLMAVPPESPTAEDSRPFFRNLRELARDNGLDGLSMGMTGDFEVAIEEGATHVRVGRAIFGERLR